MDVSLVCVFWGVALLGSVFVVDFVDGASDCLLFFVRVDLLVQLGQYQVNGNVLISTLTHLAWYALLHPGPSQQISSVCIYL